MSKLVENTQKANQSEAVNCIAKWLRVTQRRSEWEGAGEVASDGEYANYAQGFLEL